MEQQKNLVKNGSTVFLRLVVLALGAVVLALCVFALPTIWRAVGSDAEYRDIADAFHFILLALYVAAVPFYLALYQALNLLGYIDKNQAFSTLSVRALKRIAWCGVAIAVVFAASEPFLYTWAQHDDAPGIILFGMIIAGAALTVSVFAAVLQRLLKNAIDIKAENDLTV
jgi:hypothetical protein